MIHLYHGDGKGKTTAAIGLAVRAVGSGMRVLLAQFFKNGSSSEIKVLSSLPEIDVRIPEVWYGRYKKMSEEQQEEVRQCYTALIHEIEGQAEDYDMIIFDEIVSAYNYGMFDCDSFLDMLKTCKNTKEIILTGRNPAQELVEVADYVTEMRKEKHPFDEGVIARKGIEF